MDGVSLAVYRLRVALGRLDSIIKRMRERDEELFDRYMAAVEAGSGIAAASVAAEIAALRRTLKSLVVARNAIARAALRLENAVFAGGRDSLAAAAGLLDELRRLLRSVPDVQLWMDIDEALDALRSVVGAVPGGYAAEARAVMEASDREVEEWMESALPQLPSFPLLRARQR